MPASTLLSVVTGCGEILLPAPAPLSVVTRHDEILLPAPAPLNVVTGRGEILLPAPAPLSVVTGRAEILLPAPTPTLLSLAYCLSYLGDPADLINTYLELSLLKLYLNVVSQCFSVSVFFSFLLCVFVCWHKT